MALWCRLPARAVLLLLVGVLVSFEAKEGEYVALIDEGARETSFEAQRELSRAAPKQAGEAETKPPLACDVRKKQAEVKLADMQNKMQALGVKVLTTRKKTRDLKNAAENGDADFAGRKKAKEDYPAKYHRLLFKVKQKLLARSPAVGMAKELKKKTDLLKENVATKTALKYRLGNKTAELQDEITLLKAKAGRYAQRTQTLKATLDKRTKSYEGKFQAELQGLVMAKKNMEMKMEISEKKRQTGLNARKNELTHKTRSKKAELLFLQPKVDHYADLAVSAQKELTDLQKAKATKEGKAQEKLSRMDAELVSEQADKAVIAKKQAQERHQKQNIMNVKARGQMAEIGTEAEVEEKHVAKQDGIRKSQAVATLAARTEELRDSIKALERGAEVREASIQFKMIKDKATAERDGVAAIQAYKKSLDDKRSRKAKSAVGNALEEIENLDGATGNTDKLKKTLADLQTDSKEASKSSDSEEEEDGAEP